MYHFSPVPWYIKVQLPFYAFCINLGFLLSQSAKWETSPLPLHSSVTIHFVKSHCSKVFSQKYAIWISPSHTIHKASSQKIQYHGSVLELSENLPKKLDNSVSSGTSLNEEKTRTENVLKTLLVIAQLLWSRKECKKWMWWYYHLTEHRSMLL